MRNAVRDLRSRSTLIAPIVAGTLLVAASSSLSSVSISQNPPPTSSVPFQTSKLHDTFGQLPLSFEANQGQVDKQVQFLARGPGYQLYLASTEAMMVL